MLWSINPPMSNYSSIGFPIECEDSFMDVFNDLVSHCETIETPVGDYHKWSDVSGAQMWLLTDRTGEVLGMNPHYHGYSKVPVRIVEEISGEFETPMDTLVQAWANPSESSEEGDYPFVFSLPTLHKFSGMKLPCDLTIQITAFAHEVKIFESEDDFLSENPEWAVPAFMPLGLLNEDESDPIEPLANFVGTIREVQLQENSRTNETFWALLVETVGGTFDVVIDPMILEDEPKEGQIISGTFWLSGMIIQS